jgi:hypothetical protein
MSKGKKKKHYSLSVKVKTIYFYVVRAKSAKQAKKLFLKRDKSAVEYVTKVVKSEDIEDVEGL